MTEIFSGNVFDTSTVNHIFIINHYFWQNYGVPTFSYNGFVDFSKTNLGNKIINAYGHTLSEGSSATIFDVLGGSQLEGYYRKWNGDSYVVQSITPDEAKTLLDYHESGSAGTSQADVSKDKQISEINTSVEGAIFFYKPGVSNTTTTTLEPIEAYDDTTPYPTTTTPAPPQGIPQNDSLILKLFFYTSGPNKKQTGRTVTQRGMPLITDIPRTQAGSQFSYRNSAEQQRKEVDNMPAIGAHVGPTPGEYNVKDTVTAPLRVSFDKNTGTWDASNQLLARLLTDIDPAMIKGLSVASANIFLNTKSKDWYNKSATNYTGQRTTGYAMPLSMQNNNPELYGPNLFKCGEEVDVEKIVVVNRSNNSFKAGDIVLCSYISGEWIVQKFGDTEASTDFSIGRWGFYKFVANSDWFFRGYGLDRSWQAVNAVNVNSITGGGPDILPARAQTIFRNKFYNGNQLNIIPSTTGEDIAINLYPYLQTSSFDHADASLGGTASKQFFQRTNQYSPSINMGDNLYFSQVPLFWGPIFVEGYTNAGYSKLYSAADGFLVAGKIDASGKIHHLSSDNNHYYTSNTSTSVTGIIPSYNNFLGSNLAESNLKQLPADIAVNGRYSDSSFPIENIARIINTFNGLGSVSSGIANLLRDGDHIEFLINSGNSQDVYGLTPINPLKIQFTPLSAELAGSDDINSDNARNMDRKLKQMSRALLSTIKYGDGAVASIEDGQSLWGSKFYTRTGNSSYVNVPNDTLGLGGVYNPPIVTHTGIKYDSYISFEPSNKPVGTIEAWANYGSDTASRAGSNLVGIIAARNVFGKSGGGIMNIEAEQRFGMYGEFITGGGASSVIGGVIGDLISTLSVQTSKIQSQFLPAWGSTINDAINSFGTTALHVMVWDYWPEQLTLFIPQYFSVLHFNPGMLGSNARTKETKVKFGTSEYKINVDQIEYDVDFVVPTLSGLVVDTNNGNYKHEALATGVTISSGVNIMAPENRWKVNTIRRGQLVTDPGFFYNRVVIGLNEASKTVRDGGLGFQKDDKITISKDLVVVCDSTDGTCEDFHFDTQLIPGLDFQINGSIPTNTLRGTGFTNASFPASGYVLTIPSPRNSSKPAKIAFTNGITYNRIEVDLGPQLRCPITRLSSSSSNPGERLEATKSTALNIDNNVKAKYPGKYEAFYFFHNDIGHTYQTGPIGTDPSFSQHITINIG